MSVVPLRRRTPFAPRAVEARLVLSVTLMSASAECGLGQENTPYLLFALTESRPHICGMATPEALEAAAALLMTMAAEARSGQPKAVLPVSEVPSAA